MSMFSVVDSNSLWNCKECMRYLYDAKDRARRRCRDCYKDYRDRLTQDIKLSLERAGYTTGEVKDFLGDVPK